MAEKTKAEKQQQRKSLFGVMGGGLGLVAIVLVVGGWQWGWFQPVQPELPAEFADGFGEVLHETYHNPSGTFQIKFPTQPNVIDVGFMGFPVINYYAVDTRTGSEYKVSHIKDVQSMVGTSPTELLINANQVLLGALIKSSGMNEDAQFTILANENGENGERILIAEINGSGENNYALYKFVARENALMVIDGTGAQKHKKDFQKYLDSFVWLQMENNDQGTIDLGGMVETTGGTEEVVIVPETPLVDDN